MRSPLTEKIKYLKQFLQWLGVDFVFCVWDCVFSILQFLEVKYLDYNFSFYSQKIVFPCPKEK